MSRKAHPVTDVWALKAIRLIHEHLPVMYSEKGDLNAHEQTALGAMRPERHSPCFRNSIHGMSRRSGPCSMCRTACRTPCCCRRCWNLPKVMRMHAWRRSGARSVRIWLAALIQEAADFVLEEVKRLCKLMNIPNLRDRGIPLATLSSGRCPKWQRMLWPAAVLPIIRVRSVQRKSWTCTGSVTNILIDEGADSGENGGKLCRRSMD